MEINDLLEPDFGISPYKIIRAERFKRMLKNRNGLLSLLPTNSVKIVFLSQSFPEYIVIHSMRTGVVLFNPNPIICRICIRYGHRSQVYKGKTRCPSCGGGEGVHDEIICKTQAPKCPF